MLPSQFPDSIYYILPALIFCIEAGWYLLVSLVLSAPAPRAAYLRSKILFDRVAGGVMACLGIRLITTADS